MNYGITNNIGKIKKEEVKNILKLAKDLGISFLDTAQAYGESEELIGELTPEENTFRIISKLSSQANLPWTKIKINELENSFQKTLKNLKADSIDSYLIHNSNDLRRKDSHILINYLSEKKHKGFINRIGVSIYNTKDLDNILLDKIDLVQIPLSIYDQRLIKDGTIKQLVNDGILIHARSAFLQGLILKTSIEWPDFISNEFKNHHKSIEKLISSKGLTMLDISIYFLCQNIDLEAVLVGVTSMLELKEIAKVWHNKDRIKEKISDLDFNEFAWSNEKDLDPREWD